MSDEFEHGDHICALYETEAEQLETAAAYLAEGFRNGERCLYSADSAAGLVGFRQALHRVGIDASAMASRGAFIEVTKHETHLLGGRFDSERMLQMLNDAVESALNDGFAGLRTCGDMSWLLEDAPGTAQVVEYEALLNQFFQNVRAVGMCQYDRRRLPPAEIDQALATHLSVVFEGRHQVNPFYRSADIAMNRVAQSTDLNWKLGELRRR